MQPVVVFETGDPLALAFAKATLEQASIPFQALGEINTLVNDIDPMVHKWIRIAVAPEEEAKAREVLEAVPPLDQ